MNKQKQLQINLTVRLMWTLQESTIRNLELVYTLDHCALRTLSYLYIYIDQAEVFEKRQKMLLERNIYSNLEYFEELLK